MVPDSVHTAWDVVVVGTGMGGATLGYALARAGKRVLFCEKGRSPRSDDTTLSGDFAEVFFNRQIAPASEHAAILARAGRWWSVIEDRSGARVRRFIPFLGSGCGRLQRALRHGPAAALSSGLHTALPLSRSGWGGFARSLADHVRGAAPLLPSGRGAIPCSRGDRPSPAR